MKNIAIYGREFSQEYDEIIKRFFDYLIVNNAQLSVYKPFKTSIENRFTLKKEVSTYTRESFDPTSFDLMLSVGGDGTMLDATTFIKGSGLPVLGMNTGRLGFLSSIDLNHMEEALDQVLSGRFMLDKRRLLKVESDTDLFGDENFGLNELTVHKKETQSMITIHTYVNGKLLNTYWADGLIIATPTGSTAYSLSCGGPIILPNSGNFIITPVAPHNLNVRSVLISDESIITLKVEGRSNQFLVSLDSRSETIPENVVLNVMKGDFEINLIRLKNHSFLKTLRNKLHWGYDKRN
jgi:NAD+ kinase